MGQIAASLTLLTSAGLLLTSLWRLQNAPLGIRTKRALTASFTLSKQRYPQDTQQLAFFWELCFGDTSRRGYFLALGIPIVRGRGFGEADRESGEQTVILNQSLAGRLFPDGDPIGKRIGTHFRNQRPPYGWRHATAIIRTSADERATADWVRAEIRTLDPNLPVTMETMGQQVNKLLERPKFNAALLGLFARTGMLLAAIGLYGLISYLVTERTQEMGVGMALGATRAQVMKLILSQAMTWTAGGAALGLLGSFWVGRFLRTLLFQVPDRDPVAFGAAVLVLFVVAELAVWSPCRTATRVEPMSALRHE